MNNRIKKKGIILLLIGILLSNLIALQVLYWLSVLGVGAFLGYILAFCLGIAMVFLIHKKTGLSPNQEASEKYAIIIAITVFYGLILNGIHSYHTKKLLYKKYTLEELYQSNPGHGFAEISYTVNMPASVKKTWYDYDEKKYYGEFLIPLHVKSSLNIQPWIYVTINFGWKREHDLMESFNTSIPEKGTMYVEIANPMLPRVDFGQAKNISKSNNFKDSIILYKTYPFANKNSYQFWKYLIAIIFNIMMLVVVFAYMRKPVPVEN